MFSLRAEIAGDLLQHQVSPYVRLTAKLNINARIKRVPARRQDRYIRLPIATRPSSRNPFNLRGWKSLLDRWNKAQRRARAREKARYALFQAHWPSKRRGSSCSVRQSRYVPIIRFRSRVDATRSPREDTRGRRDFRGELRSRLTPRFFTGTSYGGFEVRESAL